MKSRKWTSEEKLAVVMQGLKGEKSVSEICRENGLSQTMYCKWHDAFVEGGAISPTTMRWRLKSKNFRRSLEEIETIKSCHPFWGYRRVTALLKHRLNINVNHKKVYGIMKEHNLTVPQARRREMRPGSVGSKPRAERPNEYRGIDMTKFMVESVGRVFDCGTLLVY